MILNLLFFFLVEISECGYKLLQSQFFPKGSIRLFLFICVVKGRQVNIPLYKNGLYYSQSLPQMFMS